MAKNAGPQQRAGKSCSAAAFLLALRGLLLLLLVIAAAEAQQSILDIVRSRPELSLLAAGLETWGLATRYNATGNGTGGVTAVTLFAPSNQALEAILDELGMASIAQLDAGAGANLLMYNTVGVPLLTTSIDAGGTSQQASLYPGVQHALSRQQDGAVLVRSPGGDARVVTGNLLAAGGAAGVVHVTDAVLLPAYTSFMAAVARRPELSFLRSALQEAGFTTDSPLLLTNNSFIKSRNLTLFAPINVAWDDVLPYIRAVNYSRGQLLSYHMASGMVFTGNLNRTPIALSTAFTLLFPAPPLTVVRAAREDVEDGVLVMPVASARARVVIADIPIGVDLQNLSAAPRSLLQVIDTVLLPFPDTVNSAVAGRPQQTSRVFAEAMLRAAAIDAGLHGALHTRLFNGTAFVPTDTAMTRWLHEQNLTESQILGDRALCRRIVQTHIIPGVALGASSLITNGLNVTTAGRDILAVRADSTYTRLLLVTAATSSMLPAASPLGIIVGNEPAVGNGRAYVHDISSLLLPPDVLLMNGSISLMASTAEDLARRNGLRTLLQAVSASDASVLALFTDPAGFTGTILAPTDAAFAALLTALQLNASQLLADKVNLRRILNAHIIPNAAMRLDKLSAGGGQNFITAGGSPVTVRVDAGGGVYFSTASNNTPPARWIIADVPVGGRGTFYVIDQVLLTPDVNLTALAGSNGGGGGSGGGGGPQSSTGGGIGGGRGSGGGGGAGVAAPSGLTALLAALAALWALWELRIGGE